MQEIEAVVERLHERFGTSKGSIGRVGDVCMLVPQSGGFHVHVGNEKRGFPLSTVKNVVSTYVANERPIDGLRATERICGSGLPFEPLTWPLYKMRHQQLQPPPFNMPWSMEFAETTYRLHRYREGLDSGPKALPNPCVAEGEYYPESPLEDMEVCRAAFQNNVSAWLTLIDVAPNLQVMQQLQYVHAHGRTLNLRNLEDYTPSGHTWNNRFMTIEFRQHAETLQVSEIRAWMDVGWRNRKGEPFQLVAPRSDSDRSPSTPGSPHPQVAFLTGEATEYAASQPCQDSGQCF